MLKISVSGTDRFQLFNDPGWPIPADVTRLTGVTDQMATGHAIDLEAVERLIDPAVIVIAPNSAFDRRFAERLHPVFANKGWGVFSRRSSVGRCRYRERETRLPRHVLWHVPHRSQGDC